MNPLREAAQQALEALEHATPTTDWSYMITALRAALARQDEPVAYTTGHCENHKQKGGCQLHNLQCGWPDCDRKPTTASSQQAEPVEQLAELQAMLRAEVDRLIAAGIQPQRKLVPLTEEEIERIGMKHVTLREVIRAVERAHGIGEQS